MHPANNILMCGDPFDATSLLRPTRKSRLTVWPQLIAATCAGTFQRCACSSHPDGTYDRFFSSSTQARSGHADSAATANQSSECCF
jgi:hypothetical protein